MKRTRKKKHASRASRCRTASTLALAMLLCLPVGTQGAADQDSDDAPPEAREPVQAEPAPADDDTPATEVFLPTEEISEDYAAPFPVDI